MGTTGGTTSMTSDPFQFGYSPDHGDTVTTYARNPTDDHTPAVIADELDGWLQAEHGTLRGRNRLLLADAVRSLRRIADGDR
jgi:hypothetical protein